MMTGEMQRARLIPTTGIGNEREAEQRATSALLAVMTIVRDFSVATLSPLGASRAKRAEVEAFTEVEIALQDGTKVRPDGLIRVTYGSNVWSALVEVKTGDAELQAPQLNSYLLAAREIGADKVLSISNEIGIAGAHPTPGLNVRSNSRITIDHLAWSELLAAAIQCKVHAGVDDPEQAWILEELIRYLEHPSSGALAMSDMGASWVEVRDGAKEASLRRASDPVQDVASKWGQLTQYLAIRLQAETGAEISRVLPRGQRDPKARLAHLAARLADDGILSDQLRITGAVGDIEVVADLRARRLTASVEVPAPGDRKGRGSVSWLVRQISRTADPGLLIDAYAPHARTPISATLQEVIENPDCVVPENKDINRFQLTYRTEMGQARKSGGRKPGFVDTVAGVVERLYAETVQHITPWTPSAPQVKRIERHDTEPQPSKNSEAEAASSRPTITTEAEEHESEVHETLSDSRTHGRTTREDSGQRTRETDDPQSPGDADRPMTTEAASAASDEHREMPDGPSSGNSAEASIGGEWS